MATKAEAFKANQILSKPRRAPKRKRPRKDTPVDTAAPGVSATHRKVGKGATAKRNRSARAGRKAEVQLENSATKPSRRSTRASKNRGLLATSLERAKKRKGRAPTRKAAAARAKATKVRGHG